MSRARTRLLALLSVSLLVLLAPGLRAEPSRTEGLLNKLLAPGPLMEGHAKLEGSDCLKCHVPKEGVPAAKCLDCHKPIRIQLEAKRGFHGLAKKACIECHSDHKGRDFDSTKVDPTSFNHSLTGYILEGKHAKIQCTECHLEKRSKTGMTVRPNDPHYIGAQTSCNACHKNDDIHHYTGAFAKKSCGECHGMVSWSANTRFDHARDAHYRLEGKHAELKCADCHNPKGSTASIYHWPKLKSEGCLSCHANQHGRNLGPRFQGGDCTKCHTQDSWKVASFNHQVTGWPLRGAHADQECKDCHKQSSEALKKGLGFFKFTGLKTECLACHQDQHLFGNFHSRTLPKPNRCEACHSEKDWKQIHGFDHNENTRFAIGGKHNGLKCEQCHIQESKATRAPRIYLWKSLPQKTCEICHANPHTKTFPPKLLEKRCTECHVDTGWFDKPKGSRGFDHSTTRFSLTGKHSPLSCKECHGSGQKQVFKFSNAAAGFCIDCHKNVHVDQFSKSFSQKSCAECHTTTNFTTRKTFDHSLTRFGIDGAHAKLDCGKCHTPTREVLDAKTHKMKSRFLFEEFASQQYCVGCHLNVHKSQFTHGFANQSCTACHTTKTFLERKPFNHARTGFLLRGKHEQLDCKKCHAATAAFFPGSALHRMSNFRFHDLATKDCATCHKDPHEGKFGTRCSDCHNERGWKSTQDFHKNFTLSGIHYSLECTECHRDHRKLAGMSENCKLCHQKDDVHNGTLPNCGACHRQQFWEQSRFNHSLTQFPLRGAHRTLDCYSCHNNGVYKGTPSQCVNCHLPDATAVSTPPHVPLLIQRNCSECHNQFSFQ